jgi:uncharacterized protein (DUF983 family)
MSEDKALEMQCPHCGRTNYFPGFESISMYICQWCGHPVDTDAKPERVQ